ncbi:MAG: VTT domain-containing protein [Phycisphaerae bacterium]|nr:VTT domain-containing protein [Phycisphaerae bacterium]
MTDAKPNHAPLSKNPRVIASGLLTVLWFTMPLGVSILLLANLGTVTTWLEEQGGTGIAIAVAVFAGASGLGLLPTYAQAIVVGWVFGFAIGLPVSVAGYLGGAVIGFGISRLVAGESLRALVDQRPKWRVVRQALVEASTWRTIGIVALVRFPPKSPFAFSNLVLAASGVRWSTMIIGSIAGMLPRTALAVAIAAQARSTGAQGLKDLIEDKGLVTVVVGVALLIGVFWVMQQIGVRALKAAGLAAEPESTSA